jgi:hypothetical protein
MTEATGVGRAYLTPVATSHQTYTATRLTVAVPGVRDFPAVSAVGVELDRRLAGLLEALRVAVPTALLSSTIGSAPPGR